MKVIEYVLIVSLVGVALIGAFGLIEREPTPAAVKVSD